MYTTLKRQKNKHLSSSECCKLEILLKSKMNVSEILELLERDKSTIYREIKRGLEFRNSDWSVRKEYSAYYSLNIRGQLMSKTGRKLFYEKDSLLLSYIQSKLEEKYSPDAISGELRHQGISTISTQTIYNYISLGLLESIEYRKYTNQCKSKSRTAYNNTRGRSIEECPFELKERVFGNWEDGYSSR